MRSPTAPPSKARSLGGALHYRAVDLPPVVSSGLVDYLNNPTTYDGTVLSIRRSQECGN